jgi:hypothetical protein
MLHGLCMPGLSTVVARAQGAPPSLRCAAAYPNRVGETDGCVEQPAGWHDKWQVEVEVLHFAIGLSRAVNTIRWHTSWWATVQQGTMPGIIWWMNTARWWRQQQHAQRGVEASRPCDAARAAFAPTRLLTHDHARDSAES